MTLIIPILAVIPGLMLLIYFNARQNYHLSPEIVWSTVLLGAVVTVLAVAVESLMAGPLAEYSQEMMPNIMAGVLARAFIGTALPEELAKYFILVAIALRHEDYERPVDALVLSVAVALGFASFENLLYVMQTDDWLRTAAIRAMTAVPSHVVNAMLMGYFIGLAHLMPHRRRLYFVLALIVPVLNHGAYDAPLFALDAVESQFGAVGAEDSRRLVLAFATIISAGSLAALLAWFDLLRRDAEDLARQPYTYEIRQADRRQQIVEGGLWAVLGGLLLLFSMVLGLGGFVLQVHIAEGWAAYYPEYFLLASSILPSVFGGAMLAHGLQTLRDAPREIS